MVSSACSRGCAITALPGEENPKIAADRPVSSANLRGHKAPHHRANAECSTAASGRCRSERHLGAWWNRPALEALSRSEIPEARLLVSEIRDW